MVYVYLRKVYFKCYMIIFICIGTYARYIYNFMNINLFFSPGVEWQYLMQGLGGDQVLFTWMMLPVMEQRIPCWTVTVLDGARAIVHTTKTQGSYVIPQMRYQVMISTNSPLVKINVRI